MGSKLFPWPWNHTKNVPGVKTFPVGAHILLKTNMSLWLKDTEMKGAKDLLEDNMFNNNNCWTQCRWALGKFLYILYVN